MSEGVTCGNCGRVLDEPSDIAAEERRPCPVCGSTTRTFYKSATVTVRTTITSAREVERAAKTHVDSVPADTSREAEQVRGHYRASLDWQSLDGGVWLLQVLNEQGDLVDGGIGDSPEDALLEVHERLIPPV